MELELLKGYPEDLLTKVKKLIDNEKLGEILLKKYPDCHNIRTDKKLYEFTTDLKNKYMKNSSPLSKVIYDNKIEFTNQALGLHTYRPVRQGKKIKMKNEIRISSTFKNVPEEFLRNIVIHELAHLKEKNHDKSFYKLCYYMEPNYAQVEFDIRLYLTYVKIFTKKLWK